MNRTVTVEIMDNAALQFLRGLADLRVIRIIPGNTVPETVGEDGLTALLNEIYTGENSSLDPDFMLAQADAVGEEDW